VNKSKKVKVSSKPPAQPSALRDEDENRNTDEALVHRAEDRFQHSVQDNSQAGEGQLHGKCLSPFRSPLCYLY